MSHPSSRPRRYVGVLSALVTAAVVTAACGGSSNDGGPKIEPASQQPAAEPTTGLPAGTSPAQGAQPQAGGGAAAIAPLTCPAGTVNVSGASSLKKALASAKPGTVIRMAPGTYGGKFTIDAKGSASQPIWLCGGRDAVLDGKNDEDYILYLNKAAYVRLVGFSVRNGRKGVMADRTTNSVISGLSVSNTGDEAIHLRSFSTDNVVVGNVVRSTGHRRAKFGEGVYVGSATSNWPKYSNGGPDKSDRNKVVGNDIAQTTSENIDIKEGTTGGLVSGNKLSGAGMTDADSFIDVKGNDWTVTANTGTGGGSVEEGIQTHVEKGGWGQQNIISANRLVVNGTGFGIYIHDKVPNTVACNNVVIGAAKGLSNVKCNG
jgi:hypothetical protein